MQGLFKTKFILGLVFGLVSIEMGLRRSGIQLCNLVKFEFGIASKMVIYSSPIHYIK